MSYVCRGTSMRVIKGHKDNHAVMHSLHLCTQPRREPQDFDQLTGLTLWGEVSEMYHRAILGLL